MNEQVKMCLKWGFLFDTLRNDLYDISREEAEAVFTELWSYVEPHLEGNTDPVKALMKIAGLSPSVEKTVSNLLRPYLKPEKEIKIKSLQDLIDLIKISPFTSEQLKELLEQTVKVPFSKHVVLSKKIVIQMLENVRDYKDPPPIKPSFFYTRKGEC